MELGETPSAGLGRGIDWRIESAWPIDPLWVLAFGLVAIVLLGWLYLRRGGSAAPAGGDAHPRRRQWTLLALRASAVLVVLWMIGLWRIERDETDLPDLVLLIDNSRSMTLPSSESAAGAGVTRWESVVDLLTERDAAMLERLAEEYRLRPWQVGESRIPLPAVPERLAAEVSGISPDGEASRLGDALQAAVDSQRGRSTAAIVMLGDGIVTAGTPLDQAARDAAAARLPVFFVYTGGTEPPPQIAIAEVIAQPTAMVGDYVQVVPRIRWAGASGENLRVRLIDEESRRELASDTLPATPMGSTTVPLAFVATEPGLRRLRVEVEPLPGEIATEDNHAEVTVDVRDESFRVLLIGGDPSYEFRFLKHLLERATNHDGTRPLVQLISVLQSGDARYADQDRTASRLPPVDAETLDRLDLIILSDSDPAALGPVLQRRIVDLVTRAGTSLVVIAGPDHLPQALSGTPLEPLLPIDPDEVSAPTAASEPLRWRLTPLGRATPSLRIDDSGAAWRDAPPFYWLARGGDVRPGARVLLETAGAGITASETGDAEAEDADRGDSRGGRRPLPIVVSQLIGNGQVWLQLTDESFRLRAADPDAEMYERYWLQMVRSLARRPHAGGDNEARLAVGGERFPASAPIPFRVELGAALNAEAGGQVEIVVSQRDGRARTFRAGSGGGGSFRGVIEGLEPGTYRAVLTRPASDGDPPRDAFTVEQNQLEMSDTTVDRTALESIAAMTGGRAIAIEDAAAELMDALPPGRAVRLRPLTPVPIWNHWAVALCLFGLLSAEWLLRHRWGSL